MSHIHEFLLLLVASWAFWPVSLVLFIGFWACSEKNKNIWAVITLGVLIFLTNFQYDYLSYFDSWYKVAGFAGIYALVGAAYSFMRWYFYVRGQQSNFITMRDTFLREHNLPADFFRKDLAKLTAAEAELHASFIELFKSGNAYSRYKMPIVPKSVSLIGDVVKHVTPVANKNKATITARIAYWPTSFLWFALSDIVVELAESVYRLVGGKYQQLADSMFKEVL
jgi:hypothetical protein